MGNPEQAPEPTMEEILASIRRIIADDESNSVQPEMPAESVAETPSESVAEFLDKEFVPSDSEKREIAALKLPAFAHEAQGEQVPRPLDVRRSAGFAEQRPRLARKAADYAATTWPKSLEDSIKDALRPLVRQWLDENMPRVLRAALLSAPLALKHPEQLIFLNEPTMDERAATRMIDDIRRVLSGDAGATYEILARRTFSLRVPTVDERASLYLRAVHGSRDFTSEEMSKARERVLDAMAADVAAKLGIS